MKRKLASKITLRFKFFFICMAEYVAVVLLSELAVWLLRQWLGITVSIPLFVWAILFSMVLGGVITNYIMRTFIDPITRLGQAMKEVAGGSFHVKAVCTSKLKDVQDIYDSFNRMVMELDATETLQTDFISNVSHEFKTPINAIEGYVSLLQDHQQTQQEQDTYIEKILFNTRRLSALTGNILLLSKISNQSIKTPPTAFRLDEQVRQAIVALERKWEAKDIQFDVELDKITYTGHENLLIHVWTNLIDNAIKFDPPGGLIRMRMFRQQDGILFTIEDNGPGIPQDEQERIFHKFYQGDNSREMDGNGLGLALVRQIVALSAGRIQVENLSVGGSRFSVWLPMS